MENDQTRASLGLLLRISRELATTLDLRTVLTRVLRLSVDSVNAERASLIVVDENGQPVDAAIVYGDAPQPYVFVRLQEVLSSGLAGWVMRTREPVWIADTSCDARWLRRPDDEADQSGPKSAICAPLFASQQLVGILTIVHPVPGFFTEEHMALVGGISDIAGIAIRNAQLYASLQVAHRRYQELFEDSMDPILITSWQGVILDANRQAERYTVRSHEQLLDQPIMELFEMRWDRLGQHFVGLLDGRQVNYETVLHQGELERPIEVYVRQIEYSGSEALQWILRDISERKELDRMRDDLAAMIYHDLRSPLANIVSGLDVLSGMLPLEQDAALSSVFDIARRSTERLQRLINSLLDINRLEAGQAITCQNSVLPSALAREAVEAVKPYLENKHQEVVCSVRDDLPELMIDADMIRRVLINLLENAAKYSPSGSQIGISAETDEVGIRFCVIDQGPGIPVEAREMIFEKFVRLPGTRASKGLGLGLAFCRLAVHAHGGKIWVDGDPGGGSRFCFDLPVVLQSSVTASDHQSDLS